MDLLDEPVCSDLTDPSILKNLNYLRLKKAHAVIL